MKLTIYNAEKEKERETEREKERKRAEIYIYLGRYKETETETESLPARTILSKEKIISSRYTIYRPRLKRKVDPFPDRKA